MQNKTKNFLLIAVMTLLITSCAAPNPLTEYKSSNSEASIEIVESELQEITETHVKAGFFRGVWHGIVSPIALVAHVFNPEIGVYQTYNTGNWYAFGFLLGCGALLGGSNSSRG